MKLHYSQTKSEAESKSSWFYYLMKLHYSQTTCLIMLFKASVLLPYEITLFSNFLDAHIKIIIVLLPYEITLFSNLK